jgi:hypothetical protein
VIVRKPRGGIGRGLDARGAWDHGRRPGETRSRLAWALSTMTRVYRPAQTRFVGL